MSAPEQTKNIVKPDPSLNSLLDLLKKDIMLSTNCHAIGTVKKVNVENQTVDVSINYKKTQFVKDGNTSNYKKKLVDYPLLVDVPFLVLTGGAYAIRMPIKPGDTCLLCFNDRDIDNWFSSGDVVGVATPRIHSLSDGIAIVGIRSSVNKIADYDADAFEISNGELKIKMGASKATIENSSKNLKTILTDLIEAVEGLQIIVASGSSAGTYTPDPTTLAALGTAKTDLGGLLE